MKAARLSAILAWLVSLCGPASALVEAGPADIAVQRYTVVVYSTLGRCSGVVVAHDLVLTAAHCVAKEDIAYRVGGMVGINRFSDIAIAGIVRHPRFAEDAQAADLALIKLKEPLHPRFVPAFVEGRPVREGDRVIVGGYGKSGEANEYATLRSAMLVVSMAGAQVVLRGDIDHGGPKLGGCGGDSGGPVFTYRGLIALVGIMVAGDCKGKTVIVPVSKHYLWIVETATKLGSPLK